MNIFYLLANNLFFFIIIISIIVFVHEMGHYLVAKFSGVKVESFSIGFGREIWGFNDRSGTRWKISYLPFGGYVKMLGDRDPASSPDFAKIAQLSEEQRRSAFYNKPVGVRAAIVVAGPIANFIFAILILTGLILFNGRFTTTNIIKEVVVDMPAHIAGLQVGDRINKIDNNNVKDFSDIEAFVSINQGKELLLEIERNGQLLNYRLTPKIIATQDALGNKIKVGRIGIISEVSNIKNYNFFEAFQYSIEQTYKICKITLISMKQILLGERGTDQLSGPIRIAKYSGQIAKHGIINVLGFIAMISINLGLVNLLPIPLLDGGHLSFYLIEALKGSPLNPASQNVLIRLGIIILFSLMVFSTFNDLKEVILN